jgi:hypothetical protein
MWRASTLLLVRPAANKDCELNVGLHYPTTNTLFIIGGLFFFRLEGRTFRHVVPHWGTEPLREAYVVLPNLRLSLDCWWICSTVLRSESLVGLAGLILNMKFCDSCAVSITGPTGCTVSFKIITINL